MLVSPNVGGPLQALGASLRFSTRLSDRQREAAILTVAVAHRSDFEWLAHEAVGRAAGLTDVELLSIRDSQPVSSFDGSELAVLEVVGSLIERRDLDDDLFDRAESVLGVVAVVELVVLVGYYETLALLLRTFRTPLPAGRQEYGIWSDGTRLAD
jgi:alkylhydroperoxidase family enzyme